MARRNVGADQLWDWYHTSLCLYRRGRAIQLQIPHMSTNERTEIVRRFFEEALFDYNYRSRVPYVDAAKVDWNGLVTRFVHHANSKSLHIVHDTPYTIT